MSIYYFSAIATWHSDKGKAIRHNQYIERLREENVSPILGKFKEKDIYCKLCDINTLKVMKKNEQMSTLL